jgi:hypothetical protein
MPALSLVFARSQQPFIQALTKAAHGDEVALETALKLLDQVPALPRRRLLSCYNYLSQTLRHAA